MADVNTTDRLLRTLIDEVRGLRTEFKETYITKDSGPYVRSSDHDAAIQFLQQAHIKDVELITQSHKDAMAMIGSRLDGIDAPDTGKIALVNKRVDKYDEKANWLNNLVYGLLVCAMLGLLITTGASRNLF